MVSKEANFSDMLESISVQQIADIYKKWSEISVADKQSILRKLNPEISSENLKRMINSIEEVLYGFDENGQRLLPQNLVMSFFEKMMR